MPHVSINLTEIDVPKVKIGDRATVTFDSQPDKTFTGKVISIDTTGSVSSGVTTYPTVIRLDTDASTILPNMAASASIITNTKDNVIMVPSASVLTGTDGNQTVRIMKNGAVQTVTVQTGLSSDTQTEILSGVTEKDVVVTSVTQATTTATGATTSPFSMFGGARTGGSSLRRN
jgi:multidrug efflux pump subunit AcrA (membrane-fusion protein)